MRCGVLNPGGMLGTMRLSNCEINYNVCNKRTGSHPTLASSADLAINSRRTDRSPNRGGNAYRKCAHSSALRQESMTTSEIKLNETLGREELIGVRP